MPDVLRPYAARIAAWLIALLVTWLASKFGVIIPPEDRVKMTEGLTVALVAIFVLVYSLVHPSISKKTNPADASTTALARHGKNEQERLK